MGRGLTERNLMPVLKLTRRRNESVILRDKDTVRAELLGSANAPKEKP